ncbi:MAG: pirin family protein [Candidatus Saccharibacteria bacterium]
MERLITILPSGRRESRDFGWLQTSWLLSFDDYYDPDNIEFGVLRVFNDDTIAPRRGFPAHRHSEMEIVTVLLAGRLNHRDSAGNEGFLKEGDVQRMSAGTGVVHSEMNNGKEPLHMLQLWFLPDRGRLRPSYEQGSYPREEWRDRLLPLVSGMDKEGAISMSSPATLYGSALSGQRQIVMSGGKRRVLVYLLHGDLAVEGRSLEVNGQVRCEIDGNLRFNSGEGALFVAVEMPEGDK